MDCERTLWFKKSAPTQRESPVTGRAHACAVCAGPDSLADWQQPEAAPPMPPFQKRKLRHGRFDGWPTVWLGGGS